MVSTTPTQLWNDSCAVAELKYALEHGAVGATSNPTIVFSVLQQELADWKDRIAQLFAAHPTWTDAQLTWQLIEDMAVRGASLLRPIFDQTARRKGYLSIQTNPEHYMNTEALVSQAIHFATLAPNMQVKIPATAAGVAAIEEVTARGISVNATVCFTVPQAIAVAEAVERGLRRHEAAGGTGAAPVVPVCTIMVGRLDDWMKVVAEKKGLVPTPGALDWAGVACMKRAYKIFQGARYRTRLLAAAYRNHLHWSELIGGDVILTIPTPWQRRFNASSVEVMPRMDHPVPVSILAELSALEDFRRAYEPQGLAPAEFDSYGATARTLRSFLGSYYDLVAFIRDLRLPNPDR